MFLIFEPSGRVHGPQHQLCLTLDLDNYFQITRRNPQHFRTMLFLGNFKIVEIESFKNVRNPRDPFYKLLKISDMGSISSKQELGFL